MKIDSLSNSIEIDTNISCNENNTNINDYLENKKNRKFICKKAIINKKIVENQDYLSPQNFKNDDFLYRKPKIIIKKDYLQYRGPKKPVFVCKKAIINKK